jgi:multicomponent Na+:H+ antiporter subunit B
MKPFDRRMNTLIFRSMAPFLVSLMLLFSVFVLLRGHNLPGGGFIGGLIAVCAFAILGISNGVSSVRRALKIQPLGIAAIGLMLAALAGLVSIPAQVPFMTGLWIYPHLLGEEIALSTPMLFDLGVYLVVVGSITSIALALEERNEG